MILAGDPSPLPRKRLLDALSSSNPVVVLTAPAGAGASTTLRQWASERDNVTWAPSGTIPDPAHPALAVAGAALIIDHADALGAEDWSQLYDLRAAHPQLLVRLAVHGRAVVPAHHSPEFADSLLLTSVETAEYLAAAGSSLEPSAVHRITGGLAAAVRAIARLTVLSPPVVESVLASLPPGALPPEQAVLAAPDVLTTEVAEALGVPEGFLDRCERAGMGEWTAAFGHPLFVLTEPVRAATRAARATAGSVDDGAQVRRRAADVLLAQHAWYGALREGAATRSLDVVDAALKGGGLPLIRMHGGALLQHLHSIRPFDLRRWPVIAMALALIFNARREHRVRAVELMGIALIGARSAPAGSAERALLKVIESVIRRLLGVGDGGVKAAQAAARMLAEIADEDRRSIDGLLGDLHNHAGISLMYGGHDTEAVTQFETALASSSRPTSRLISYGGIALVHAGAGDTITAQSWIDTALRHPWHDDVLREYQGSMLLIAQAWTMIERDELDAAEDAVMAVWPIIDTIEHWPLLAYVRSIIDICRGTPGVGLERLHALRRERGSRMPRLQARLLDLAESSLNLAIGDVVAAGALTAHSSDVPAVAIGAARAQLFAGRPERALQMLGAVEATTPADRAAAAALEAVALKQLGRDATELGSHAASVAETYDLRTPFLLLLAEGRELFGGRMPWGTGDARTRTEAPPRLTPRELVLLRQLVSTPGLQEIATQLHVSVNTIKTQRRSLYRKLGAASRDEALMIAAEHGLLRTPARKRS